MSDHVEHVCSRCGSLLHYDCAADAAIERAYGVKYARPETAPTPTLDGLVGLAMAVQKATETEPPWQISDIHELNRTLGRMARLERLKEENETIVGKEVARLKEWLAKENEALEKRRRDLEAHVRVFAEANREMLGRYRNLPHGRIEWRRRKVGVYRLDQSMKEAERREALLKFAESAARSVPEEICLTISHEEPDLEAIKAFLAAHDDPEQPRPVPRGLEWVPPGEHLVVSVEEGKKP